MDFKTTNDPNSTLTPSITDVMSRLSGSSYFIKLDLRDAYLKMEVYVTSLKIEVDVAYPKYGYFHYKHLSFGVHFAPALEDRTRAYDTHSGGVP